MIRYEDISARDMQNYWGNGIILMQTGSWNAYTMTGATDAVISLTPAEDYPEYPGRERRIIMSYDEFFANALLHHPPLGVVRSGDAVYLLTWGHPDGMAMCKALLVEDVAVTLLYGVEPRKPEEDRALCEVSVFEEGAARWRERMLALPKTMSVENPDIEATNARRTRERLVYMEEREHVYENARPQRVRDRQHATHDRGLHLVLEFLNQEFDDYREAVREDADNKLYVFDDLTWGKRDGEQLRLYSGGTLLGHTDVTTGKFVPATEDAQAGMFGVLTNKWLMEKV